MHNFLGHFTFYFVFADWEGIRNLISALPPGIKRIVLVSSIGVTKFNELPWRYDCKYFLKFKKCFWYWWAWKHQVYNFQIIWRELTCFTVLSICSLPFFFACAVSWTFLASLNTRKWGKIIFGILVFLSQ